MNQGILQHLQLQSGQKVLEIGFGGGDLIHRLLKTDLSLTICGIDPSSTAIAMVQQQYKDVIAAEVLTISKAFAEAIPWPDDTFDAIATINTLYFWPDVQNVLLECHRVLKPGGILAIAYNAKAYLEEQKATQFGFRAYEVSELEFYLKAAGFSGIQTVFSECARNGRFCFTRGHITDA